MARVNGRAPHVQRVCEACVENEHMWNGNPTHNSEGCTVKGCGCEMTRCFSRDQHGHRCCRMLDDHPTLEDGRLAHATPVSVWNERRVDTDPPSG